VAAGSEDERLGARSTARRVILAVVVAVVVAALAASRLVSSEQGPVPGDALDVGFPGGLRSDYYTLDWQSVVTGYPEFQNRTDRLVVIDRIEPVITRGAETVIEVHRIELAREEKAPLDEATFQYYPPVTRFKGRCVRHDLHPPEGHRLGPGEHAILAIWIRTLGPGPFRIDRQEIFYQIDGREFRQTMPFAIVGRVPKGSKPRWIDRWSRQCAHKADIVFVPSG
jgi:hypothetical protein